MFYKYYCDSVFEAFVSLVSEIKRLVFCTVSFSVRVDSGFDESVAVSLCCVVEAETGGRYV